MAVEETVRLFRSGYCPFCKADLTEGAEDGADPFAQLISAWKAFDAMKAEATIEFIIPDSA
jgi:hypothetical protein